MKKRIISGAIMTAIAIAIIAFGGAVFDIAMGVLSICAYYEIMSVRKKDKLPKFMYLIGGISTLLIVYNNIKLHSGLFGLSFETLALVMLIIAIPTLFAKKQKYSVNDAFYLMSIVLFIGITFNLIIKVYESSLLMFIMLLIVACITDIFALFGGMLIGKHQLSKISPKKTIEGSVVGTLFATIIASTYYATLIGNYNIKITLLIIILSLIGQMGDLFFSLIKRENDVKDFSKLIPGHGGILDRIDSFIFVILAYVVLSTLL